MKDYEPIPLAQKIALFRRLHSMSQHRFARRAGVSYGLIQALEQRVRIDPRLSTLRKLSTAMNMSLDDLVEASDDGLDLKLSQIAYKPIKHVQPPPVEEPAPEEDDLVEAEAAHPCQLTYPIEEDEPWPPSEK